MNPHACVRSCVYIYVCVYTCVCVYYVCVRAFDSPDGAHDVGADLARRLEVLADGRVVRVLRERAAAVVVVVVGVVGEWCVSACVYIHPSTTSIHLPTHPPIHPSTHPSLPRSLPLTTHRQCAWKASKELKPLVLPLQTLACASIALRSPLLSSPRD